MTALPPNPSIVHQPPQAPVSGESQGDGGDQANPLAVAHRLLRDRYPLAVALGLLGLVTGAVGGFFATSPRYQAIGQVHVASSVPRVIFQNELTQTMDRYDQYLRSQAQLMKSQRVTNMAMSSETWKAAGVTDEAQAREVFSRIIVDVPRATEYILLSAEHNDALVAAKAVESLMNAYQTIFDNQKNNEDQDRTRKLNDRELRLKNQIEALRKRLTSATNELGPEGFKRLFETKIDALRKMETEYEEARNQLAVAEGAKGADGTVSLPAESVAVLDPAVRDAIRQRNNLANELEVLRTRLGSGHRSVVDLQNRLEQAERQLSLASQGSAPLPKQGSNGNQVAAPITVLKARLESYAKTIENMRAEVTNLGRQNESIDALQSELAATSKQLDLARNRMDELATETLGINGRLTLYPPDKLEAPSKDNRLKFAFAGGLGGSVVGVAIVMLLGFLDRRMRKSDDLRLVARGVPMLGVLPALPDNLADPEQAALSAHAVHHIRTLMQISQAHDERHVFVVTSPAAATGKTSLALSLGLSFAATGALTLVVDCDLVGGGLTKRVDAIIRRRIGTILRRGGLISEQQLESALEMAHKSGKRVGEVLVDMGWLKSTDVTQALALQRESTVGLMDVIDGEQLENCVTALHGENLYVLPLGNSNALDAAKLSPRVVNRVLEQARKKFEVVIIDTGPVPGSIEAATFAAMADGTLLVVSRGEDRTETDRAIEHLVAIGARVSGMVFNRAAPDDMQDSAYRMSQGGRPTPGAPDPKANRFDPLARAVSLYGPPSSNKGAPSKVE